MLWDTSTDEIQYGSRFSGSMYPNRFDVSWDGEWLVYFAMGRGGVWTGVCQPPFLKTTLHWPQSDAWLGGGLFSRKDVLLVNTHKTARNNSPSKSEFDTGKIFPFKVGDLHAVDGGEDEGVLYPRLRRDGWKNVGQDIRDGEDLGETTGGWWNQPTKDHPILRMWYRGVPHKRRMSDGGFRIYDFHLDSHPELLVGTQWATWDSLGQLLVVRKGVIERYDLSSLQGRKPMPTFSLNLTNLPKQAPTGP